jgi:hypothetical protein
MVLPYTPIWRKQVQQVKQEQLNPEQQISLLVANVLHLIINIIYY